LSWLPTLGIGFAGAAAPNAADTAGAVDAARRSIQVVVEAAPFPLDPWGAPTTALRLHRAVKERFDPDHLLAPGRFVGGI
jgi:glycolate oxidase FAD binding subunit